MKRNVLIFGLISGLIISSMLVYSTAYCYTDGNFEGNMTLGFLAMFIAFTMVFFGIKNYRDKELNGIITFGKAFETGLYIVLFASTMYVVVWLIDFYLFLPDFMDKYAAFVLGKAQADGVSDIEFARKTAEMNNYKEMYKNPLYIILLTYAEVVPIGLLVNLISSLILQKKTNPDNVA